MKRIDKAVLDNLVEKAQNAPRKRANFNLHQELNDPVQRLCIAMEPDTYVRPHRHSDPPSWEVLTILRGALGVLFFDESGNVMERIVLDVKGPITTFEFPENTWHAPFSLEPGTVVFEVKQGPYKPIPEIHQAPWSPREDSSDASRFLAWCKKAKPNDSFDKSMN
ncbi:MAG: WbuC family cupin fold metalloprotein [Nitrospirota bacterium]